VHLARRLRVEDACRTMKSGLDVRPMFHHAARCIHAHVALTVWSLLLQRVAESRRGDTWRNIRNDLKSIKRSQLSTSNGDVWQVTGPDQNARERQMKPAIQRSP
jgi:transposase